MTAIYVIFLLVLIPVVLAAQVKAYSKEHR